MNETFLEKLAKMKRFDFMSVVWMDASQSRNVNVKASVPNNAIETKVISEGRFLCVQKGEAFGGDYLVLVKDLTEDMRATIQAIPVPLLREVNSFAKTQLMSNPLDRLKTIRIRYSDGIVKTVKIRERRFD